MSKIWLIIWIFCRLICSINFGECNEILATGACPDDIEIFMFGLLSLCKFRGDEITMLVATDGSLGGKIKGKVTMIRGMKHKCFKRFELICFCRTYRWFFGRLWKSQNKIKEKF